MSPKFFWVVIDIPYSDANDRDLKILNDLRTGSLEGLRGISDSKQILTSWFVGPRNAAIFLNPDKIMKDHVLEKIPYDDPDKLCVDNFRILYRIFNKEKGNHKYNSENVMYSVLSYVKQYYNDIGITTNEVVDISRTWSDNPTGINSTDDLFNFLYNNLPKNTVNPEKLHIAIHDGLKHLGRVYKSEGEWIVHSSHLHIPKKSLMMIGCDMEAYNLYQEWASDKENTKWMPKYSRMFRIDKMMEMISRYKLDEYYTIKFVDESYWNSLRDKLTNRRGS